MNKTIPIMPCSNADVLVDFYKSLGFELVGKYVRSYIILKYDELEFHFYGAKKIEPQNNSCMCVVQTDNLEKLYNLFSNGLKTFCGEMRRTGFPKISKIRTLCSDVRFTLSDPSGNTFYILTPTPPGAANFFRELSNVEYAEKFEVLYDLVYSKEDIKVAGNLLPKLIEIKDKLDDLDKAKLLLAAMDINSNELRYKQELSDLIQSNIANCSDWEKIKQKVRESQDN